MRLPPHLEDIHAEIKEYAHEFGLDFFPTIFEMVTYKEMNMVAAYGGFPKRYPHWRFGMEYERLSKSYTWGLSKIYELVINNDPSYAYLLESNPDVDQKLVMAHVFAHVDFFKNNYCFRHTNRKMVDTMANHGTKVHRYIERFGVETVESFIDTCLSIENLIDIHSAHIRRHSPQTAQDARPAHEQRITQAPKLPVGREYMEHYINPPAFLDSQRQKIDEEHKEAAKRFPVRPERDVMMFLMEHAPLENWQRDILGMIRDEAYYFAPQGQTKIMNEGWASYWHSTIMTTRALKDSEVIDFADHHSGAMAVQPGQINPYKLGLELFRDIEERWNKGRFGKDYEECDDIAKKARWDRHLGLGREKIFEVRKHYNDVTFIDAFLTPEFCSNQKMFTYDYDKRSRNWYISSREFEQIKQKLLIGLTNFGQPLIEVQEGNYQNRGELLIRHVHEGVDLRVDYMRATLKNLYDIWSRPVVIDTIFEKAHKMVRFDGNEYDEKDVEEL